MFSLNNKILLLDILQYLLVVISYLRARGLYNYTYGVFVVMPLFAHLVKSSRLLKSSEKLFGGGPFSLAE